MSIIVRGYRCKSTDLKYIEKIISKIRTDIIKVAKEEYKKLLVTEIERLFDDISLNKVNRPQDNSIFNIAKLTLDEKIKNISIRNTPVEYNFNLSIHILLDEKYTYFKINSNNFIYTDIFNKFSELEEYILTSTEAIDISNIKTKNWNELMKNYSESNHPFGVTIINGFFDFEDITPDSLSFTEPKYRVESLATKEMLTRIVNMYGCGNQIPPTRLMDYIEDGINRIEKSNEIIDELEIIKKELSKIIQPITPELIS